MCTYQGEQHYHFHYVNGDPEYRRQIDHQKKERALEQGITLIAVPYWWDMKKESLLGTIQLCRPDLVPKDWPYSKPIPNEPPTQRRATTLHREYIDESWNTFPYRLERAKSQSKCFGCSTILKRNQLRLTRIFGSTM